MLAWLFAAGVAAAVQSVQPPSPAPRSGVTPAGAVQLVIGQRVTVRLPSSGLPEEVSVGPAPDGGALPPAPGKGKFDETPRGSVVFTLERFEGDGVMMKVQSGIDQAFDYHALMIHQTAPGKWTAEPTSVCTVLPQLSSYEHWPKRPMAAGIVLSDFKLKATNGVDCEAPPAPKTK